MIARAQALPHRGLVQVICPLSLRETVHWLLAGIRVENGQVVKDAFGRVEFRNALALGGHGGDVVLRDGVELHRWVVTPNVGLEAMRRAMPVGVSVEAYGGES